jgi:hypothetical protein
MQLFSCGMWNGFLPSEAIICCWWDSHLIISSIHSLPSNSNFICNFIYLFILYLNNNAHLIFNPFINSNAYFPVFASKTIFLLQKSSRLVYISALTWYFRNQIRTQKNNLNAVTSIVFRYAFVPIPLNGIRPLWRNFPEPSQWFFSNTSCFNSLFL